jgi:hypothetical protein
VAVDELIKTQSMKRLAIATLVLFITVAIAIFLISKDQQLHPSKDGGFPLRVLLLCVSSMLFFSISRWCIDVKVLLMAFLAGIAAYVCLALIYGAIESFVSLSLSMNTDNLLAGAWVFIFGLFDYYFVKTGKFNYWLHRTFTSDYDNK